MHVLNYFMYAIDDTHTHNSIVHDNQIDSNDLT